MISSTSKENSNSYIELIKDKNPSWLQILMQREGSLLLSKKNQDSRITIGVPHHAPRGISRMLCDRNADENVGYLGCYLALKLSASFISACHYYIDPNKQDFTDYSRFIASCAPKLHIEIHGHGNRSAKYDIEISSGPEDMDFAKIFSEKLNIRMKDDDELNGLSVSGDYSKIYFTAQYSVTVTDPRWHTLHIELPPLLRKDGNNPYPPSAGFRLMDIITDLIKDSYNF